MVYQGLFPKPSISEPKVGNPGTEGKEGTSLFRLTHSQSLVENNRFEIYTFRLSTSEPQNLWQPERNRDSFCQAGYSQSCTKKPFSI